MTFEDVNQVYIYVANQALANDGYDEPRPDRTGTSTYSTFGVSFKLDIRKRFPLLQLRHVNFNTVVDELLWMISGSTNVNDMKSKIWHPWADEYGELGPVYGFQLRHFGADYSDSIEHPLAFASCPGKDQLIQTIFQLQSSPFGRRHLVIYWNVSDLNQMRLPPCVWSYQFYVTSDRRYLDILVNQRSCDVAVGLPHNIASYALLLNLVANECGYKPRFMQYNIGDCHVYTNHVDDIKKVLTQDYTLCNSKVEITKGKKVVEIKPEDIKLSGYKPGPKFKFEVAV